MEAITQRLDKNKISLAIGTIWLFQLSAIIGMTLGFSDWFLPKTPLNLSLIALFLLWLFPIAGRKTLLTAFTLFSIGMTVEALGIRYEWIFGPYYYGENLGPKLLGVPLLIGVNWMMLTFVTAALASQLVKTTWAKILLGSALMVLLDLMIEHSAYGFNFWFFEGNSVPLRNYITWLLIGGVLHSIYHFLSLKGDAKISAHIYFSQLVFFGYFFFADGIL